MTVIFFFKNVNVTSRLRLLFIAFLTPLQFRNRKLTIFVNDCFRKITIPRKKYFQVLWYFLEGSRAERLWVVQTMTLTSTSTSRVWTHIKFDRICEVKSEERTYRQTGTTKKTFSLHVKIIYDLFIRKNILENKLLISVQ